MNNTSRKKITIFQRLNAAADCRRLFVVKCAGKSVGNAPRSDPGREALPRFSQHKR